MGVLRTPGRALKDKVAREAGITAANEEAARKREEAAAHKKKCDELKAKYDYEVKQQRGSKEANVLQVEYAYNNWRDAKCQSGGARRKTLRTKFNHCVKAVRKTVKARKGSNKESAAIAICTKTILHPRGRTVKRYRKGRLLTQKKMRGGTQCY
jgi:hypothetical protein